MYWSRLLSAAAVSALLAACSSGGSPGSSGTGGTAPTPTPTPTPAPTGCSLRERQNWAAAQLDEWYLFPETLPGGRNPGAYSTVSDYVDSLTATARSQGKDRYFTYVTSIAEENAYYETGSTAAFGIRLQIDGAARRVIIADSYENSPAFSTGLDRGIEILAIGTSAQSLRNVSDIIASDGEAGVASALGPSQRGVTRTLRVLRDGEERVYTLTKDEFAIMPVSNRWGWNPLEIDGQKIGYINLRTFISTAEPALRRTFDYARHHGARHLIIDLRYNGGGLVSVAELLADLLGGARNSSDIQSHTRFRPSKAQYDETRRFQRQPESATPLRIAFITTRESASASEMVINAMLPWMKDDIIIVGADTYGKPVGQIARDRPACDDRLRIVAFSTRNADNQGDYFGGLADSVQKSCAATDELEREMGNPLEASTRTAIDALLGRSCTPISGASTARSLGAGRASLLSATNPSAAQRDMPGTF